MIDETARISSKAIIGKNVSIGPWTIVGPEVVVGDGSEIGSHVVLEALDRGFDVTVFDDLSTGLRVNIQKNVQFVEGSTLSITDLSIIFETNKFDAVIHLAASKAASESMLVPIKYAQNNIIGGLNLINVCCKHKIKVFIFSSSCLLYTSPSPRD